MIRRAKAYSVIKIYSPPFVNGQFMAGVRAFLTVVALTLLPAGAPALSARLPPDEGGLEELLSARAIDTVQYEQLLAFYALPLSVPRGELGYLALIFPDIVDMIPVDPEELSAYRPFDNRQIRRLFSDYPALEDFEPILRFNDAAAPAKSNGEVAVGINRSRVEALKGHRVRFRRKGGLLSVDGGLAFSDSAALWQNRSVGLSYGGVNARAGNFGQPVPGELAFGRFAPLSSLMELTDGKMSDIAANWLYGGNGAWNGVAVDAAELWGAGAAVAGASVFCHLRPAEAGGGAAVNLNVGRRFKAFAGFTVFWIDTVGENDINGINGVSGIDGAGDDYGDGVDGGGAAGVKNVVTGEYCYAHLYAEYRGKIASVAAEAAAPLAADGMAPALSLRLNHRVKGASAEYRAIFYPGGGAFPMSRLKKQLFIEAGGKEPSRPIQKHAVRMAVPLVNDAVKLTPELNFVESGGVKRISGQAQVSARLGPVDAAARHAAKILTAGADSSLHTSSVSISYQTACPVAVRASFQSVYGYYKNPRNTYAVEAPTTVVPGAVVVPYVRGNYARDGECWLGIKSEFHLYKKTWTGITLEFPVDAKGEENVYVKVSSSYSF